MQDLNAPANPLETLAYIIAQQIHDHSVVYIGTGLPMVAGILAKKTHAPSLVPCSEQGQIDAGFCSRQKNDRLLFSKDHAVKVSPGNLLYPHFHHPCTK